MNFNLFDINLAIIPDAIIFVLFLIGLAMFFQGNKRKLPPGPLGLPILGYLPWINSAAPYKTLSSLVDKYGRIYSLKMGSVHTTVLADPEVIRKVLNMEETTGRAPLYLTHGIMKGRGLICAEGDLWKEHRKFVVGFMRNNGMRAASAGKHQMQIRITQMAGKLVQKLNDCPEEGCDIKHALLHIIGNTMNGIVFGLSYDENDPKWVWLRSLLEEGIKLIGVAGPINFLPWLRFLPSQKKNIYFIKENQIKTHEEYKKIMNSKEKIQSEASDIESDLLQEYIKKRRNRGPGNYGSFTEEQIFHVLADMFGAGTETTHSTIQWHLIDLALNPTLQKEIYSEIKKCSIDGYVKIEDFASIPLCQAAIMETQRLRNVIPIGIPHGVLKDMEIEGYHIPKGSMILPLLWRIHHDEAFWEAPGNFNPKRFLDEEGKLKKFSSLLPFQTGRRVCIGEELAKIISITFITKILLNFKISFPEGIHGMDLVKDPICGLSLSPKPFKLVFSPIQEDEDIEF